mmetsp:Transcript_7915/g.12601  ORF Transcript_7915/g.12601 Transcript_7915/m.12601 type:complete len:83 (-) Transcript_7915:1740-1988(-)
MCIMHELELCAIPKEKIEHASSTRWNSVCLRFRQYSIGKEWIIIFVCPQIAFSIRANTVKSAAIQTRASWGAEKGSDSSCLY